MKVLAKFAIGGELAARNRGKPDQLATLDDRRKGEEANFRREEGSLEERRMLAQAAYVEARKAAISKVVGARAAYRKPGGAD